MINAQNTKNKIAFCTYCMGPLTGEELAYCNEYCINMHNDRIGPGLPETEYVFCNKNMVDLARGEKIFPHAMSAFIHTGYDLVCVAEFVRDALDVITDAQCLDYDAWWRGVSRLNQTFEQLSSGERAKGHPHQPRIMREVGMFSYLCDEYGISTEKNVAAAIGELTREEGWRNPIGFINSL